jgi:two-component system, NarL family, sensor kinase
MPVTTTEIILILSLLIIFIVLMVSFIITILFFIQKKQKSFTSDLNTAKENYDKELYKAQSEIQEQTFQEISREIHDNVGQLLSLARLGLGTLDMDKKDEVKETIVEISDILEKALEELRHMSHTMNAEIIKKGGLKKSIEMQVGFMQRGGRFNIQFNVNGEYVRLTETKEIILFRIVQEAVNNIIRHAKATEICISLGYNRAFLKLVIQDNGKGFSLNDQILGTKHLNGIYNMQHRAKLIEAEFEIDSKPGNGTSITVTTPY